MDRASPLPLPAAPAEPPKLSRIGTFLEKLKGGDLRRLLPRLRPHRGKLAIATVMLLASTASSLVMPTFVGKISDSFFETADQAMLDRIAAGLLVLVVVQAAVNFVHGYLLGVVGERVVAQLRSDVFSKLLSLPPAFFADRRTGELTSRLGADVMMLQSTLTLSVTDLIKQSLILIGAVVALSLTDVRLTVIALGVVPLVVGSSAYFGKKLQMATLGVMDQVAEATAVAEESFSQVRVVQSFVREQYERKRYDERMDAAVQVAMKRAVMRGFFFSAIGFCTFLATLAVLYLGGRMVLAGEMTPGTLITFFIYSGMATGSIGGISGLWTAYQEATGSATRVFEILNCRPNLRDPDNPVELPQPVRGEVAFDNVWFRYETPTDLPMMGPLPPPPGMMGFGLMQPPRTASGKQPKGGAAKPPAGVPAPPAGMIPPPGTVPPPGIIPMAGAPVFGAPGTNDGPPPPEWTLRGITVRVEAGETIALVGPSGAGKTTFVSLVSRFWDPQQGTITMDGIDLRDLRLADLRTAIGLVPQETLLFSGTIRDNISYGRPGAPLEDVIAAARTAHAHEFVQLLPDGYDTKVGERGIKLSGGQRQRIALARAVLKDPAVLILDEATSSLDNESEALIEDALQHLLHGRTTFIIAHRLSTVRRADRLLVIDRGTIAEEGTHAELLARGGLYTRLYSRQFRDDPHQPELMAV